MRTTISLLVLAVAATMVTGCAKVERKFGLGMANTLEILRGGEFRRTVEQAALWDTPDYAYTTGVIRGVNRTLARTGIGIYEIITAPLPPYDPILTDYFAPGPVYPDNYVPGVVADSLFATDTSIGFSGGDVIPFMPGSRFRIFDVH
ncbi:MAG TPA: exosortase system-associated protein, TIGR04073 family [Verrucomicrobiota bacterium]|nr:exosortase system-associated protein, TIGR04073 family [Verrucomicrobiota bacterium]